MKRNKFKIYETSVESEDLFLEVLIIACLTNPPAVDIMTKSNNPNEFIETQASVQEADSTNSSSGGLFNTQSSSSNGEDLIVLGDYNSTYTNHADAAGHGYHFSPNERVLTDLSDPHNFLFSTSVAQGSSTNPDNFPPSSTNKNISSLFITPSPAKKKRSSNQPVASSSTIPPNFDPKKVNTLLPRKKRNHATNRSVLAGDASKKLPSKSKKQEIKLTPITAFPGFTRRPRRSPAPAASSDEDTIKGNVKKSCEMKRLRAVNAANGRGNRIVDLSTEESYTILDNNGDDDSDFTSTSEQRRAAAQRFNKEHHKKVATNRRPHQTKTTTPAKKKSTPSSKKVVHAPKKALPPKSNKKTKQQLSKRRLAKDSDECEGCGYTKTRCYQRLFGQFSKQGVINYVKREGAKATLSGAEDAFIRTYNTGLRYKLHELDNNNIDEKVIFEPAACVYHGSFPEAIEYYTNSMLTLANDEVEKALQESKFKVSDF